MDIHLYAEEAGAGTPLILLHGNGEDHSYFAHQIPAFAEKYHVIALDTRGHGKSPRGNAPFTLEQFADDLKVFLDARGIQKCRLLGFSDGGNVALLFSLRYPAYVDALILNGANLSPVGVKPVVQLPILLGWVLLQIFRRFDRHAQRKWEFLNLMVSQPHIKRTQLHTFCVPTLVIAGTRDMIRTSHTQAIARALPNHQLAILPGTHFLAQEQPDAFNRTVLAFFAGVPSSGSGNTICH